MKTPITDIVGIGSSAAAILAKHGFQSAEDIAASDVNALCAVPGFGPVRAKTILAEAVKVVSNPSTLKPAKKKPTSKSKSKDKSKKSKKLEKKKDGKSVKSDKKGKKKKSDKKGKSKAKSKKKKK